MAERPVGIDERLLVFLEIAVVGEGDALHDGHQAEQVPVRPARLAAHDLGDVGIFFLGHDGRARGMPVGHGDEPEKRVGPPDELFAEAREMPHAHAGAEQGLQGEIPVGHGIHAVVEDAVHPQLIGNHFRCEGVGRAGERRRAQGRDPGAPLASLHALHVPLEHPGICQQMLRQAHRLRGLHMCAPGQQHAAILFSAPGKHRCKAAGKTNPFAQAVRNIQTEIEADLVIAAAPGMQLLAHIAHDLGEPALDVHVHVFQLPLPGEGTGFDLRAHLVEPVDEPLRLLLRDDALPAQHARMRLGSGYVLGVQDAVEGNGFGIGFHGKAGAFFKASAPGLFRHVDPPCSVGAERTAAARSA